MKNRKSIIIMLIVFLAIGFATVSTTLVIKGILAIGENKDDFNIIFTKARLNEVNRNDVISEDKKHINFVSNELKTLEDKAILEYEVTNTSRNYDADVQVTCSAGTTELITFEYTPHQMEVLAGETKSGTFTVSMFKVVDQPTDVPIECTLTATAKTREELGEEYVAPFSKSGVMMKAPYYWATPTGMWAYRSNITRVIFENELIPHETTEELTFDVSEAQDKSVMAYLVPNGEALTVNEDSHLNTLENTTAYTLYLQGDTGIIANKNSSSLFYYFNNLLEIKNMQYLDTSNVTDVECMFSHCKNLNSVDLSNFDTSNVTNMSNMFCNCYKLESLNVKSFNTTNVTDMSAIFSGCENLTSLDLNNFDTGNVTNMTNMFSRCSSLTNLDVSNFDTSKVILMDLVFNGCTSIEEINLSNFNTSNVTSLFAMFRDCQKLTSLNVSSFDTSSVTNMGDMFRYCKKLNELNLSNFKTNNVTTMQNMFSGCNSLSQLNINSFDTSKVTIMSSMFSECKNLLKLDITNFNTSNVTNMNNMFLRCTTLESIDVSSFDTSKVTEMRSMFAFCTKVKKLDLSNFVTTNLKLIGSNGALYQGMFSGCYSLLDLDISNFDFSNITNYKEVFYNMSSTAIIKVKDSDAQKWILDLTGSNRPSSWTTENVVIKEAA